MELSEIILSIRASRSMPTEEDLRSLPHKKAFIYGRVSSQGQVRDSRESIHEVAKLMVLARQDGYRCDIDPDTVEEWLESIQNGEDVSRTMEDGDVAIDCRDLGLSGSLGEDKRPGLNALWQRVEAGEIGAVYLTEGMSRLSRDRDRVLGYKLLKLLKEEKCRIRTPEGVYSPAVPRDWDYLASDIEDSAEELKKMGVRLGRRRASKASQGRHVGNPVCPGYIVEIEAQRRDGSYIMGKWRPYPAHQEIVIAVLKELVRQGSVHRAAQSLTTQGVVFPFFPDDLKYMESRSVLRQYRRDSRGYLISSAAIKGLATNLSLIGIWEWMDVLIEDNHEPAVPVDLFLQAYEVALTKHPRGRAAYAEPMEWSDLLYCYNHDQPRKIAAHSKLNRWACIRGYQAGLESRCLYTADHVLTPPLTREFLRCLDLTPHAQAVLERLKAEAGSYSLEESRRRRRETELKSRLVNLRRYLGTADAEREEIYWQEIQETKARLEALQNRPPAPRTTPADIERVTEFLENLESNWERYPRRMRNRLLKLLVDRVEIRHDLVHIEATVVWKMGFYQRITISRPTAPFTKDKRWQPEEDNLLRMLWPTATWEMLLAALPRRTAGSINSRASKLKAKRLHTVTSFETGPLWSSEDEDRLRELYTKGVSTAEIASRLGRTEHAILGRASVLKIRRPKGHYPRKYQPRWEAENVKVMQDLTSPAG